MFNDVNYVYGDQNVQVPAHLNFGKFMLNHISRYTNEIALVNTKTGEEVTYKEFVQNAVDLSVALYDLGIKKGETVAFCSEKRNDYMSTAFAIIFTGATFTAVNLQCGRAVLLHKLEITKPKYLICTKLFWDSHENTLKLIDSIKTIITLDDSPDIAISIKRIIKNNTNMNLFEPAQVAGQSDVAIVYYSSGTTGMSKGVMLTHENCIVTFLSEKEESVKVLWTYAEWYHSYDFFLTCNFLALGSKIVYHPEFTNDILVKNIQDYAVNIATLVPSSIAFISTIDIVDIKKMDSIRILYSTGAPLHVKTIKIVTSRFPNPVKVIQSYGMTETGGITSGTLATQENKLGSVGMLSPGITVKVVDQKTSKVLGTNQLGEICIRGPLVMKGYIGVNPESYMDELGFFKTGDLGYYDDENYFFIVDRIKEIINYNGEMVAPVELETILQLHPDVLDVGVVGKPDPFVEELPTAFVVKKPGSRVTEEELVSYVALEVSDWMQLRGGIKFINEIPRNSSQKILRNNLRDLLINKNI